MRAIWNLLVRTSRGQPVFLNNVAPHKFVMWKVQLFSQASFDDVENCCGSRVDRGKLRCFKSSHGKEILCGIAKCKTINCRPLMDPNILILHWSCCTENVGLTLRERRPLLVSLSKKHCKILPSYIFHPIPIRRRVRDNDTLPGDKWHNGSVCTRGYGKFFL